MATLSERLASQEAKYDFSDKAWVRFLKDHRKYLISNSTVVTLDPNIMNGFRYHTTELLIEYKLNSKLSWLIKWINQIKGDWEVVDLTKLLVPSDSAVDSLWDKYKSYKNKIAS